jgi:hypothetical protein
MDRSYAAELDKNGRVVRVIVGSALWASENLGGLWVDSDEKVGAGWETYENGLRPPRPYLSWFWEGARWCAPIPPPHDVECEWDEENASWVEIAFR